jgi:hypothetical protein
MVCEFTDPHDRVISIIYRPIHFAPPLWRWAQFVRHEITNHDNMINSRTLIECAVNRRIWQAAHGHRNPAMHMSHACSWSRWKITCSRHTLVVGDALEKRYLMPASCSCGSLHAE